MVDQAATGQVQGLNILLRFGFGRRKLHSVVYEGRANCLGIIGIVLLAFQERLQILRRDHLDRMAKYLKLPLPIEDFCAGLDACEQGPGSAITARNPYRRRIPDGDRGQRVPSVKYTEGLAGAIGYITYKNQKRCFVTL
nr:hypothetical protein [Roseovarius sp. M141]